MIKSILVPFDGSEYAKAALVYAIQLSQLDQARVDGLFVIDTHALLQPPTAAIAVEAFIIDSGNMGLSFNLELQKELVESGESILRTFEDICDMAEVQKKSTTLEIGLVGTVICEKGKTVDLIVMGKRGLFEETGASEEPLGSVVTEVIKTTIRPVMVVPNEYKEIKRLLLAYDGSEAAGRALQLSAYLEATGKLDLKVLVVADSEDEGRKIGQEAKNYLLNYELQPEVILERGNPTDEILLVVEKEDLDLIVMGAFGKNKIRELLLGSTTQGVVRQANRPVLLHR